MQSQILEQLAWRYATKNFDASKKLSAEKLTLLKEAFNLTATSYGLQPLKLVIVATQEIKKQLVPLTMNQKQVADCSHVLVLCTEMGVDGDYISSYFDTVEATRNTPRKVLSPFETFLKNDFASKTPEQIQTWASKQAYLALGNLLTVCAVEKIDACPIEGFEPAKYDAFLGLTEKGLQSVLVCAEGYRNIEDPFAAMKKVRRGTNKVVIEI